MLFSLWEPQKSEKLSRFDNINFAPSLKFTSVASLDSHIGDL